MFELAADLQSRIKIARLKRSGDRAVHSHS